jgi:branched-chain amino acid transport system permease protein
MAAVGYVLQRGLLNRALDQGSLAPILVTFGLAIVITNLLQEIFTVDNRSIQIGALETDSIRISSDLAIGIFPLITFVVGIVVIVGLQLFLSRTRTGRAMRATSDDRDAAVLMGINNRQLYAIAAAIALGIVGVAGVFLGMRTQFNPGFGDVMLIFAFEAVIIGGLGSLWGTLAGGMILGVAQVVGAQAFPAYGVLFGHLVFLLVLVVRPQGLIPKAVNS